MGFGIILLGFCGGDLGLFGDFLGFFEIRTFTPGFSGFLDI